MLEDIETECCGEVWRNLLSITSGSTGDMSVAVKAFNSNSLVKVYIQAGQKRQKKSTFDSRDRP